MTEYINKYIGGSHLSRLLVPCGRIFVLQDLSSSPDPTEEPSQLTVEYRFLTGTGCMNK